MTTVFDDERSRRNDRQEHQANDPNDLGLMFYAPFRPPDLTHPKHQRQQEHNQGRDQRGQPPLCASGYVSFVGAAMKAPLPLGHFVLPEHLQYIALSIARA